jgi:TatD DNase family protein
MYKFLVDSHCHLDLIEENGISFEDVIINSKKNNIKILQTICTKISNVNKIIKYTEREESVYCSIGTHPCNVTHEEFYTCEQIKKICENNVKIIGIGETGLDYFHDKSTANLQKKYFLEHINVSRETKLPTIIHSRDADIDMADILKIEQKNGEFPALLHCFSSSYELAKNALDLGVFISISGIVTFKNATDLQKMVRDIPLDMLLIETDSPYLSPIPYRGKINQPAYLINIADFIATIKNISVEEVINHTTANFLSLFEKAAGMVKIS